MNPIIENELRLNVMKHVNSVKSKLKQPINKKICEIKLQPFQLLSNFIDTKSIFIENKICTKYT